LARSDAVGTRGDIFAGVAIQKLEDAVDRSSFQQGNTDSVSSRQNVIEFCRLLRQCSWETFEREPSLCGHFSQFTLENLKSISRFHQIIDSLPHERHWPDGLQLWSAEVHGAEYFVSLDKRFINQLRNTAKIDLPCLPVLPSKVIERFGGSNIEPMPVEDSGFIDFGKMVD